MKNRVFMLIHSCLRSFRVHRILVVNHFYLFEPLLCIGNKKADYLAVLQSLMSQRISSMGTSPSTQISEARLHHPRVRLSSIRV